jgi:glycosyltransferase involved in cell wall biosynthesis
MADDVPRREISVAMIAYQHEAYIAQAVDSVLMQDVDRSIELVIGDDCSSDRTASFSRRTPARTRTPYACCRRRRGLARSPTSRAR